MTVVIKSQQKGSTVTEPARLIKRQGQYVWEYQPHTLRIKCLACGSGTHVNLIYKSQEATAEADRLMSKHTLQCPKTKKG